MLYELGRAWELPKRDKPPTPGSRDHPIEWTLDTAREQMEAGAGGDVDAGGRITRAGLIYVPGLKRTVSSWLRLREQVQRGEVGGPLDGQRAPYRVVQHDPTCARGGEQARASRRMRLILPADLRDGATTAQRETSEQQTGKTHPKFQRSHATIWMTATRPDVVAQWAAMGLITLLLADGLTLWAAMTYHIEVWVWLASLTGLWFLLLAGAGGALVFFHFFRWSRLSSVWHRPTPYRRRDGP